MTERDSQPIDADALTGVFRDVVAACNPRTLTQRHLTARGDALVIAGESYDLSAYDAIDVVGFGKAGAAMTQAVEDALGDRIRRGMVVVPDGHTAPTRHIEIVEAAHPVSRTRVRRAHPRD